MTTRTTKQIQAHYAAKAKRVHCDPSDDEIEIDDKLTSRDFSFGNTGAWVRGWLWVRYDDPQ